MEKLMEFILVYLFCTFLTGVSFYDLFKSCTQDEALTFALMAGATWFLLPLHLKIYKKIQKEYETSKIRYIHAHIEHRNNRG